MAAWFLAAIMEEFKACEPWSPYGVEYPSGGRNNSVYAYFTYLNMISFPPNTQRPPYTYDPLASVYMGLLLK